MGEGEGAWYMGREGGGAGMIDLAQYVRFYYMIQGSIVKSLHGRKL